MPRRTSSRALLAACVMAALAATALPAAGARRPASAITLSYASFAAPLPLGRDAGEPSIGVSWKTGAVFLQAGTETDKVAVAGSQATWTATTQATPSSLTLDPIGFSDDATGRYFDSQLTAVGSLMAYTDDDGATWTKSQGSGLPAGADHQSVGGGPYPPEGTVRPLTTYPHAVYYCSQDIVTAFCARSDTGGLTFGAGVPIYTIAECGGLHGHVKVGPDGVVYVPNSGCGSSQAVAVSTDAGLTWTVRPVPGATPGDSDPAVAVGKDGTAYFCFADDKGRMKVAVSRNHGATWTTPIDVGAQLGVKNTVFPEAVAGDGDRAAVAFLGSRTDGDGQDADFGKDETKTKYVGGEYDLFVSETFDRGRTWKTVDVTPHDPVQRGRVYMGGTTGANGDRNLLDFMDLQVDRRGRVLVGWADGCTDACVDSTLVTDNRHTSVGSVTIQTGGKLLYSSPPPLA